MHRRKWNLVMESLRRVRGGDAETLLSVALCNRTVCTASEPAILEHYESSNHIVQKKSFILVESSSLLNGWSKLDEVEEMEKALKKMVKSGFGTNSLSFSYLIVHINNSIEIFDNMKHKCCLPDATVYNAMISNFMLVGDFDESMRYYRKMLDEECEPNLETYSILVSGLIKGRKVADALEIFDEMLSREIVPTTRMVTSFLKPLCSYGSPDAAMAIYRKVRKAGCRISKSAYNRLRKRLSRLGKYGMLLEMQESGYIPMIRPVSVVPPAYYADLVAFQARFYMEPEIMQDNGSPGKKNVKTTNISESDSVKSLPALKDNVNRSLFFS